METLLCLAASLVVNHRKYGGSTSHKASEPVPSLAALFQRPNSSVLAKMANLDGSRRNGAKHEVEVAAYLLGQPGELAAIYQLVFKAARDVGIRADRLPDFLHLEDGEADLYLLGQEELVESEIEAAVQDACAQWLQSRTDLDAAVTEQLLVATARVGQHRFARDVLHNHAHRCTFCGLGVTSAGSRAQRMLVASHIKPWRVCSAAERLDVRNGLTACPTHDVAFDTGLITVNGGLRIHVTMELAQFAEHDPAARAAFGRPPLGERLLLPADATPPSETYLDWHHKNVYHSRIPTA
ncbi:HNH endonuclease [Dactylosporangium sp. AC04546]|uniref:HNH endonuclease n=1 Tax=Dactylosporangium sp. AC04546 TaxID=2862460 RepID=UPI001EDFE2F1|nr:HNH endonuclease [Dactylosporangium sp. AC04546]WVK84182.1 HNH endonuclease [Dactylosporangium sp. AC04546]